MSSTEWIAALLVVFLLTGSCSESARPTVMYHASPAATGITLIVDFGNGTVVNRTGLSGANVLEVTQGEFEVEVDWYGPLAFVTAIDGLSSSGTNQWQYWVNGQYASSACNYYQLDEMDSIVWNRTGSAYTGTSTGGGETLIAISLVAGFGLAVLALLYIVVRRRK